MTHCSLVFLVLCAGVALIGVAVTAAPAPPKASGAAAASAAPPSPPSATTAPAVEAAVSATGSVAAAAAAAGVGYENCKHVIVGAGWSGSYFAWRSSVDEAVPQLPYKATETCIFEAQDRVGGRAYSKPRIPGLQDLRVDLGAYRFDIHNHVLVNHVMRNVLSLPIRCYDPETQPEPICNAYGSLNNIADPYDNNAGYAHGPEGLVELFRAAGGRLFLNHTLTRITKGTGSKTALDLHFARGAVRGQQHALPAADLHLTADSAFLNMPASAVHNLDRDSVLFTATKPAVKALLLDLVREEPGAKQFLVYNQTVWRKYPALCAGDFSNVTADVKVPIKGRLHDFYGKCPVNTVDGSDCWGAVMTYYDFDVDHVKFFSDFQADLADPYTYIARGASDKGDTLIRDAHNQFMAVLANRTAEYNKAHKDDPIHFDTSTVPLPTGTVVAVWWSRDNDARASLLPGPSGFPSDGRGPQHHVADPTHAMRNLISKPVPGLDIFIANEAYSSGEGWAHPALMMTERILYQHFKGSKPAWVLPDAKCNDCLTGNHEDCQDCVSETWYTMEITQHTGTDLEEPCDPSTQPADQVSVTDGDTQYCTGDSAGGDSAGGDSCGPAGFVEPARVEHQRRCPSSLGGQEIELHWTWVDEDSVEITFAMEATGWVGFGIGSDMAAADMVIAYNGKRGVVADQYYSTGHYMPRKLAKNETSVTVKEAVYVNNKFTVTFQRPAKAPHAGLGVDIKLDGTTPIIYAINHGAPAPPSNDTRHDFEMQRSAEFSCGRTVVPTWEADVKPLFRTKDRMAMLMSLDLFDYDQVRERFDEIYGIIKAKTVFGFASGMPPDTTWSLARLHLLKAWKTGGFLRGEGGGSGSGSGGADCTNPVTFNPTVKELFRDMDRQCMLTYSMDLHDYASVKAHASSIYAQVSSGKMPPGQPWEQSKVDTFNAWMQCGYKEGGGPEELSDNMVFYHAHNIDDHPEYMPAIRAAMQRYLKQSAVHGTQADIDSQPAPKPQYRAYFNFTEDAFNTRLQQIYAMTVAQGDDYDPSQDTDADTREKVIERLRQLAPFNLIDGAWISHCCPTGPIDEVHALLWSILNEEMGMGHKNKNHCQLYQELLNSVGIYFPPVQSLAFATDPGFVDGAFTQPAYVMALSLLTEDYFPELLGTTLQIEWMVPGIEPIRQRLAYWGINPEFYRLHIAIDNAASGHGARAKKAIELHLDAVRQAEGEEGVQRHFRRIWTGFLAFDALGDLDENLHRKIDAMPNATKAMVELIKTKATYGSHNHRKRRIGHEMINDLFGNPDKFVRDLKRSPWVVAGNPDASPIMSYLTQFRGPMFRIFLPEELDVWRNWIFSLKPLRIPLEHPTKAQTQLDTYAAMREAVSRVMMAGMGEAAHLRVRIWGPSPNIPGMDVFQPVATWLATVEQDPDFLMHALIDPRNHYITCGNSETSTFLNTVLRPGGKMGAVWSRVAAEADDTLKEPSHEAKLWTWTDIAKLWVDKGCPMEPPAQAMYQLFVDSALKPDEGVAMEKLVLSQQRRRRHTGRGAVH